MTIAVHRTVTNALGRRAPLRCLCPPSKRTAAFSMCAVRLRGTQRNAVPQDGEREHTTWSAYMGGGSDTDGESPWASLDEIADGYKESASAPKMPAVRQTATPTTGTSTSEWERTAAIAAEAFAASRLQNLRTSQQQPQQFSMRPQSPSMTPQLTHLHRDDNSRASMVDVSAKSTTKRTATASCRVYIPEHVLTLLSDGDTISQQHGGESVQVRRKGPVLHTAQLAGIMAAKRTSELIPLCHGLHLSHVDVKLELVQGRAVGPETPAPSPESPSGGFAPEQLQDWDHAAVDAASDQGHYIGVECTATTNSPTGVEMEALTGASIASLTLWDMLKSAGGREMRIDGMMVTRKTGGKSGDFERLG